MTELVSKGHPDKVADAISDVVVSEYLKADPNNKVACETLISNTTIYLCGEVTGQANIEQPIKAKLKELGYDWDFTIVNNLQPQSKELTTIVENAGANDQCVVYGYAENTPYYMPKEYVTAYEVLEKLQTIEGLKPDAKVLVDGNTIYISTSHSEDLTLAEVQSRIKAVLGDKVVVNPAGTFTLYGSKADTGVTGRKIVVDAYGSGIPVGGGAYCGKDLTKLDRVAAYKAREIAVALVKQYKLDKCLVEMAYMIGDKLPKVKIYTNGVRNKEIEATLNLEDCSPRAIYYHYKDIDVTSLTYCPYMHLC